MEFEELIAQTPNPNFYKGLGQVEISIEEVSNKINSLNLPSVHDDVDSVLTEVKKLVSLAVIDFDIEARQRVRALVSHLVISVELLKKGREVEVILVNLRSGVRRQLIKHSKGDWQYIELNQI